MIRNIYNHYRMSVSSIYEQTPALKALQQKIQGDLENDDNFKQSVKEIIAQTSDLTMPQCYRLMSILSKYLKSSNSINHKFMILLMAKQFFLSAHHHFYIFGSIKILPWVKSIASFQLKKSPRQRVKLYLQQLSLKGNGDEIVQQRSCFKLLKFVDQFLLWFSQRFPCHINALFEYSSTFIRTLKSIQNPKVQQIKQYEYFNEKSFNKFQKNFNALKSENSLQIKEMCEFVGMQLRAAADQNKEKSQLLKGCIRTSDSYCIRTIISELVNLLDDSNKLNASIKIIQFLMNQAEVQFNELVKLYCLPIILQYILSIDFHAGKRTNSHPRNCDIKDEKIIVDSIYKWAKICKEQGLQTWLYDAAIKQMQAQQKPVFHVQRKHYTQFSTNLLDMISINREKIKQIQNSQIERQLVSILEIKKQTNFEQIQRSPILWKSNISAINQLSQFKESRTFVGINQNSNNQFWKSKASKISQYPSHEKSATFYKSQVIQDYRSIPIKYGVSNAKQESSKKNIGGIYKNFDQQSNKMLKVGYNQGSSHNHEASVSIKISELGRPLDYSNKLSQSKSSKQLHAAYFDDGNQPKKFKPIRPVNQPQISSYVAFEASKFSSFSEYSVKRSNNNKLIQNIQRKKSRIKQSSLKSSLSRSKSGVKSQSMIYFVNSNEFNSLTESKVHDMNHKNLLKFDEPSDENPNITPDQYVNQQYRTGNINTPFTHNNNKNVQKLSQQSKILSNSSKMSESSQTYRFKNSMKSQQNNSSTSNSRLTNYGVKGNDLPEPTRKPKFGFQSNNWLEGEGLNKNQEVINQYYQNTNNTNKLNIKNNVLQNILSVNGSQDINSYHYNKNNLFGSGSARDMLGSQGKQISEIQGNQKNWQINSKNNYRKTDQKWNKTNGNQLIEQESSSQIKSMNYQRYQLKQSQDFHKIQPRNHNKLSSPEFRTRHNPKMSKNQFIIEQHQNDKLLSLENQLGQIKKQKNSKHKQLKKKQEQYKLLKQKIDDNLPNRRDLESLKKQNQIIQLLNYQKNMEDYQMQNNYDAIIKPINNHNTVEDYFIENQVKGIYSQYVQPFERVFVKQILGSRCLLIKNQFMELGYNYSQRGNQISLYLTLLKSYDDVVIRVIQNSILLDKEIQYTLENQLARNQLKIKRKVIGVKQHKKQPTFSEVINQNPNQFIVYPEIYIIGSQRMNQKDRQQYNAKIPCTVFNLAIPIEIKSDSVQKLKSKKVIKSTQLSLGEQFTRNTKEKVAKYFPKFMSLSGGWCLIAFQFPHNIFGDKKEQFLKFRIQNRKVQFQFFNDPKSPLAQTLVCMLTG